jgi:hypothetical protein
VLFVNCGLKGVETECLMKLDADIGMLQRAAPDSPPGESTCT